MTEPDVSKEEVARHVRNSIIDLVGMFAEFEADPPPFSMNNLINQWEDWVWVNHPPPVSDFFPSPPYTDREVALLLEFDAAWLAFADATANPITDEVFERERLEWKTLLAVAREALAVLMERGKLL